MPTREALALCLASWALLLPSGIGCDRAARCGPAADGSVVACVGDEPVKRGEAIEFLREPSYEPGSARLADPRPPAVERAAQRRLLAQEARRRGLRPPEGAAPSPAALAQALIADEAAKRGIVRDSISLDEARRFYDEHPEAFGQIDELRMQAIIVADPDKAERAFREAQGADEARFVELVARHSEDAPSREKKGEIAPVHASREADRQLLTLGLTLRRVGAIGGPVKAADGRYYVVRVAGRDITRLPPFDEQAQIKAKNILVFERKEAMTRELVAELKKRVEIRLFPGAFASLRSPGPAPSP